MRFPRVRFSVRRMIVAVAAVALVLGMLVACLRWFLYMVSTAEVFNETDAPLSDVRAQSCKGWIIVGADTWARDAAGMWKV